MPTVNEILDKTKDELSNLLSVEVFLLRDLLRDMNGTGFQEVIDCSLAPYFSIL